MYIHNASKRNLMKCQLLSLRVVVPWINHWWNVIIAISHRSSLVLRCHQLTKLGSRGGKNKRSCAQLRQVDSPLPSRTVRPIMHFKVFGSLLVGIQKCAFANNLLPRVVCNNICFFNRQQIFIWVTLLSCFLALCSSSAPWHSYSQRILAIHKRSCVNYGCMYVWGSIVENSKVAPRYVGVYLTDSFCYTSFGFSPV